MEASQTPQQRAVRSVKTPQPPVAERVRLSRAEADGGAAEGGSVGGLIGGAAGVLQALSATAARATAASSAAARNALAASAAGPSARTVERRAAMRSVMRGSEALDGEAGLDAAAVAIAAGGAVELLVAEDLVLAARVADGVEVGFGDAAEDVADGAEAAAEFAGGRAALLVDELFDMLGGPGNVADRLEVRALLGLGVGEEV